MLLNTHIVRLIKLMIKEYVLESLVCGHALHISYVGLLAFINIRRILTIRFCSLVILAFRNSLCVCRTLLRELLGNIRFFLDSTLILSQMVWTSVWDMSRGLSTISWICVWYYASRTRRQVYQVTSGTPSNS
jgi:hypothetical protein